MTTLTVIHSYALRKHYANPDAEASTSPFTRGMLPAICSPYTWGFLPAEWTRRYGSYTTSFPESHPMCQRCARKAAAQGDTP